LIVSTTLLVIPLAVALMIAVREAGTSAVRIAKVLLLVPAAMLMLLVATEATVGLLLDRLTTVPPAGAGHSSITVPVTLAGPVTGFGLKLRDSTAVGRTFKAALFVTVPKIAFTIPLCVAATGTVVMAKDLLVVPAGIVTLAGTRVAAMLSESWTTTPPAGAGAAKVTVPVKPLHPATTEALSLSELSAGAAV
jgi:hypothetical protein